ncbi:hypothetical protein Y032_0007g3217 [Ancylostoma ceylanicum]|uniref:alpha-1,2-Mannosidase n=1 Tax=Ancylostoma ceylanicum TaxID=53326 RepID=A0A016VN18_9BILA|nr:hypothetical protein Y032_0007g3217 [Ancylostoma ceylanicum]
MKLLSSTTATLTLLHQLALVICEGAGLQLHTILTHGFTAANYCQLSFFLAYTPYALSYVRAVTWLSRQCSGRQIPWQTAPFIGRLQGMRWNQLRRSSEGLPFFTNEPKSSGLNLYRLWRSFPRMKRTVIVIVLLTLTCIFTFYIASPFIQMADEASMDMLKTISDIDNSPPITAKRKSVQNKTSVPTFSGPTNERQRAVVEAFKHAWKGYHKFAWGHDQLKPVSGGYSDWFNTGLTIVDALDTAIIMGLKEEAEQATEWIRDSLSFEKDNYVNLFETTIRTLGGLLSAYHLTGDRMFVTKAEDLGERLMAAFTNSKSPVPLSDVNLKTRKAKPPPWSAESSLSEVTTLQLEFRDLSRVTGKTVYEEMAFKVSKHIHDIGCDDHDGLCDMYLNSNTGKFRPGTTITFGARADSYYEYLFKQWLQTGKTIDWLLSDYKTAMASMQSKLLRYSEPNKLGFVGELLSGNVYSPKTDHLVCFLAGTLALGSSHGLPEEHMKIAKVSMFFFNQYFFELPCMLPYQCNPLFFIQSLHRNGAAVIVPHLRRVQRFVVFVFIYSPGLHMLIKFGILR